MKLKVIIVMLGLIPSFTMMLLNAKNTSVVLILGL